MPTTVTAATTAFPPKSHIVTSETVTPMLPTTRARGALVSAKRPPAYEPIAVATP